MAAQTEALLQQMQAQIAQLQLDLQASTATATAATTAAAVATTALAAMPPAGAPATLEPRLALSPAMANAGAFLDLSSSTGAKLFKVGAEPLLQQMQEHIAQLQINPAASDAATTAATSAATLATAALAGLPPAGAPNPALPAPIFALSHADNERFAERLSLGRHAELHGQNLSISGIDARFQNGIADKETQDLTERARTSMLRIMNSRWPSAVTISNFWPYALRFANDIHKSIPSLANLCAPLELVSNAPVRPQVLGFHSTFCPVYCFAEEATLSSTASLEGDDEDSGVNATSTPSANPANANETPEATNDERPAVIPFDLAHDDLPTNLAPQDDATSTLASQAELLRWYCRLGHMPFANIRLMAAKGEIPKRLATCQIPWCQSCLYGRGTKKPWRTKAQPNNIRTVMRPGECVSVKLFKVGAEPLSQSFDFMDPSDLQVFLDLLKAKSNVQGWSRIFTVPVDVNGVVTHHSLLQDYGVIPLASVVLDALSYANTQTKVSQDSFMLFQCTSASLGTEFLKTVTTEASHYHVADQRGAAEPPIPCGALLLKVIITKAHVDTRATVSFIHMALSSLDSKMMALNSDISKFNAYVKTQVIALEDRGETTTDLLVNVFKGYGMAQDADFLDFVKRKKDAYDEGADITVTNLMDAAANKIETRVLLKAWSAPTKEQEQILALTAQALVYLQVVVWVLLASTMQPRNSPYVPKRKLSSCSQWLQAWLNYSNTAFDDLATYLAHIIHVKATRHQCCTRSSSGPIHRKATPRNRKLSTVGLARVQAHCDNAGPPVVHRAVSDSDSYGILVDGGATASISNCLDDFVRPPNKTNIRINGFNGTSSTAQIGTVKWPILDNNVIHHVLHIPDTYYVASCPMRLLSPQHHSQQIQDHRGTYSTNYGDQVLFVFHEGQCRATMSLNPATNVGIIRSAPGHQVFSCLVDPSTPPKEPPPSLFAFTVISDADADNMELQEEDASVSTTDPASFKGEDSAGQNPESVKPHGNSSEEDNRPDILPFDLDNDQEDTNLQLGHLLLANIRLMAARKEIPSRLANCRIPKCQSCLFERATKHPWRTKGQSGTIEPVTAPGQKVSLCGVSAHFQNGIAEQQIKDLAERSGTSLLHAMHRWPSAITINLWPYAIRYVNDVYNSTPALKSGQSPMEQFSKTVIRPKVLNFHPPFCPTYVLHNGLQGSGSRPNKWVIRSRCAVYLGNSPRHSRSAALVLSLLTGYISPQFHLEHDDLFETVGDLAVLPRSQWQELARFTPAERQGKPTKKSPAKRSIDGTKQKTQWEPDHTPIDDVATDEGVQQQGDELVPHLPFNPFDEQGDGDQEGSDPFLPMERPPGTVTRSGRLSSHPELFLEQVFAVFDDSDTVEDYELQKETEDPVAFATSRSDPDTLYYHQAMQADDAKEFKTAMVKEANDHTTKGHWMFWEKRNVPEDLDTLSAIWAFKRKRRKDNGKICKHKARLNIQGGQQTYGVNYWETYLPVVSWFSLRLCLAFSFILDWHTRQIDFVLAFPRADEDCDLSGLIEILPIDTREQMADLLTKPLDYASFVKHQKTLLGW
jgi:hypothetical protein